MCVRISSRAAFGFMLVDVLPYLEPHVRGGAMVADVDAISSALREALRADPPRLDHVALAIARLDDAPCDDDAVIAQLDAWGDRVRSAARGSVAVGMEALEALLGREADLVGDERDYDDPRNSFLPRVLERRRGLPILLSLVYVEVARRAGLPLYGLALPGHFVVAYEMQPGSAVVLDPFARGQLLTRAELEPFILRAGRTLDASVFRPASPHAIAVRMLRNLVASYRRRNRPDKLRAAATLLLSLDPSDASTRRALVEAEAETPETSLN